MLDLEQLQTAFLSYLKSEDSDIATMVQSTENWPAERRLGIYGHAYRARLKEAVAEDYKKLNLYLGDEQFDLMANQFITLHPSKTQNLRFYSGGIANLLKTQKPFQDHVELTDLALIERAFSDSFDAEDQPQLTFETLAALAPESWPNLTFSFQPSFRLLQLQTNAFEIWQALDQDESPPTVEIIAQGWIVWRDEQLVSRYRSVSSIEAEVLQLTLDENNFSELCETLLPHFGEDNTPVKAIQMIQGWVEEGILSTQRD